MSADIIPFAKPIAPADELTKAEASELIESSPFLKALEASVAKQWGVDPAELRRQLIRNHPDAPYDPKNAAMEIDEAAVRAMAEEDAKPDVRYRRPDPE